MSDIVDELIALADGSFNFTSSEHGVLRRARDEIAALRAALHERNATSVSLANAHAATRIARAEERERVLADTLEAIEAMARAGFATEFGVSWEHLQEAEREEWRGAARAAIAALRAEKISENEERTTDVRGQ